MAVDFKLIVVGVLAIVFIIGFLTKIKKLITLSLIVGIIYTVYNIIVNQDAFTNTVINLIGM